MSNTNRVHMEAPQHEGRDATRAELGPSPFSSFRSLVSDLTGTFRSFDELPANLRIAFAKNRTGARTSMFWKRPSMEREGGDS